MACSPLFLFPVCNWRSKEQFVYLRMFCVRLRLPYEPVRVWLGSSHGESLLFDIDANKPAVFS
jgi:hypothetical protein